MIFRRLGLMLLCSSVGIVACNDSPPDVDPDADTGDLTGQEWPKFDQTVAGPGNGTDGFAFGTATRPAGEARAGRQPTSQLIFGEDARCRPGDYLLQNDHLFACVTDVLSGDAFQATGGKLVDLVPTGNPVADEIDSFGTIIGLREGSADKVEILSDGSDGGPAVIQVTGVDLPLRLIVGTIGNAILSPESIVNVVTEYRLGADDTALEMTTWITPDERRTSTIEAGTLALLGDLMTPWLPVTGAGLPRGNQSMEMIALFGSEHSWAYSSVDAKRSPLGIDLLGPMLHIDYSLKGAVGSRGPAATQRFLTVFNQGSTTDLRTMLGDRISTPATGAHTITFEPEFGPGWSNPIWSIERVTGADTRDALEAIRFATASGKELKLDAGDYVAIPMRWPGDTPTPVAFTVAGSASVQLPSPGFHTLTVNDVRDDNGDMIPAQIRITGGFNKLDYFIAKEDLEVALPPGNYTVEISRGEGLSVDVQTVDLTTGGATLAPVTLNAEWERAGWVSGDFHQHAMRSSDSETRSLLRLYSNLAVGLDVMGPSDHDVVEDYVGIARDAGLDDLIHVFQGSEISPARGHINAFPTPYSYDRSAYGAPSVIERVGRRALRQLSSKEIIAAARADGAEIIQVNHGRDSNIALLNWVRYDPATDTPARNPNDWPDSFESMEIFNSAAVFCVLFRDWQAMLLHGHRVAGVGNSDTHNLTSPVGWPRNWLHVGANDTQELLTDQVVIDAIKNMAVSTSGGILIRWEDHVPGEVVPTAPGPTTLAVTVDVPSWGSIEHLTVVVNGIPVEEISVGAADLVDGAGRFEFDVNLTADSIVTVLGWSSQGLSAVHPGKTPFGFVNPLFMDVDGGGWTAPGAGAAALAEILTNVPFCSSNAGLEDYDPHAYMHHHDEEEDAHSHGHHHGDGNYHHH